ncbi:hypothetical protein IX51_03215 [uncultured archaeon]|nr:hypothetical protein IX51_03215 [uncultured archaeon]HKJ96425.1 hypothetical protein [Thermoplasmataceae archaeon]
MNSSIESLKSGVLTFLTQNNRSGFTENQILTAFFGSPEKASDEDRNEISSILESLVEGKAISKSTLSTKSGMKTYYKGF